MRGRAGKTRHGQAYFFVLRIEDLHLRLSTRTFQADHIRAQRKYADQTEDNGAAFRTTIGNGGLLLL